MWVCTRFSLSLSISHFVCVCECVWFLLFFCVQWIESIKRGTLYQQQERVYRVAFIISPWDVRRRHNQQRGCRTEWKIRNKTKTKTNTREKKRPVCIHTLKIYILNAPCTTYRVSDINTYGFIENAYVYVRMCYHEYTFFFLPHFSVSKWTHILRVLSTTYAVDNIIIVPTAYSYSKTDRTCTFEPYASTHSNQNPFRNSFHNRYYRH